MTNDTKTCKFCEASFTSKFPGAVFCGGDCAETYHRMVTRVGNTDDGHDAWRDSQYNNYNPKDWQWGSWDR